MLRTDKQTLWLRWVAANAFGEMLGLGLTFAVGVLTMSRLGDQAGMGMVLISFLIAVASGAIEAALVGALVAYVLGYLPSTLMSLGEQATQAPMAEPPQWIVLLLAAGLGAVGGAVLSFAQWLAMRKKVERAGWWMPANMLAWFFGMPIIFWGIDAAQKGQPMFQAVLLLAGVLFVSGAVVGAIHGAFLVGFSGMSSS